METGGSLMKNISKEELEDLYINQGYSTRDLAKYFNVGQTTIRRKMIKYEIKSRTSKEGKNTDKYKEKKRKLAEYYKEEYSKRALESGNRITKICPICGKEFSKPKSQESIYCSIKCAGKAIEKDNTCNRCGKILANKYAKYCPECLSIVKHEYYYKRVETKCAYCGKTLYVTPSRIRNHEFLYCNSNCMAKDYERRFSGENSPTWKGGKRHYKGGWLKARDKVRERDNYTCQLCGITEEEQGFQMDVHHIVNYRLFKDKREANNLDNLICLCHNCHRFIHSNSNTENLYIKDKI